MRRTRRRNMIHDRSMARSSQPFESAAAQRPSYVRCSISAGWDHGSEVVDRLSERFAHERGFQAIDHAEQRSRDGGADGAVGRKSVPIDSQDSTQRGDRPCCAHLVFENSRFFHGRDRVDPSALGGCSSAGSGGAMAERGRLDPVQKALKIGLAYVHDRLSAADKPSTPEQAYALLRAGDTGLVQGRGAEGGRTMMKVARDLPCPGVRGTCSEGKHSRLPARPRLR